MPDGSRVSLGAAESDAVPQFESSCAGSEGSEDGAAMPEAGVIEVGPDCQLASGCGQAGEGVHFDLGRCAGGADDAGAVDGGASAEH